MLRYTLLRTCCALVGLSMPLVGYGLNRLWTNPGSGDFGASANWSGAVVPGAADSATFNLGNNYTVTFDNNPNPLVNPVLNQFLSFAAGTVTFTSGSGGPYTYHLTGAGTNNADITGGTLTLGTISNPLHLVADDDLAVRGGATLNVNAGSQVNVADVLLAQTGGDGTIVVDGTNTQLNATVVVDLAEIGRTATLTYRNSATGVLATAGTVTLASSGSIGTTAVMNIETFADVTTGNLVVGGGSAGSGTINVNGSGSTLIQSGASTLTVGVATGADSVINIGTATSGAILTTGTGTMTINRTGTVNIGTGFSTLNASGDVVIDGGVLTASGFLNLAAGETMTIQNGGLASFTTYGTAANAIYNVSGAGSLLETTAGSLTINNGAQANVTAGGSISVAPAGLLAVGTGVGNGTLVVDGAASSATGGNFSLGSGGFTANATFSNGAVGNFSSLLLVAVPNAGTTAVVNVLSGASVNVGNVSLASGTAATSATLNVQGAFSNVHQSAASTLIVGASSASTAVINIGTTTSGATFTTGTGIMNINTTGTVNVGSGANTGTLNVNGNLSIAGGTLTRGAGSTFRLAAGKTMTIQNGGLASFTGSYATDPNVVYIVVGAGSEWALTGDLIIDDGAQVFINTGGTLSASGTVVVADAGTLETATSINASIAGTGATGVININGTGISLGNAASLNGFNFQGVLNIGANTVTLDSAGYARLGALTSLNGGTIKAPNGIALATGSNLAGNGFVNERFTGELGSVIEADGALSLGDAALPAGFNFAGELRVHQFAVTLGSSAQAALGNFTTLGRGGMPGTLTATNGVVVDFGDAIAGYGTIDSANALAQRSIVNGLAQGDSLAEPLTFTGYVKGVGTFDNVNFTGTFDPGLSSTILTAGNITFAPTNTLIMELGGAMPGSGYDQIQASGTLTLDGTLQVALINGFGPSAGQSFNLFDWGSLIGTFDALDLPMLTAGLMWNSAQLYTTGVLSVALAGDYNFDGTVDAADYVVWHKTLGQMDTALAADGNLNGQIDPGDYAVWRANFGQSIGPGSGAGSTGDSLSDATVPEPNSLVTLALSLIAIPLARAARVRLTE